MSDAAWVTVTVAAVKGSAPREAGAWMKVFGASQAGSIGGGALEWEATRIARDMIRDGTPQLQRNFPLGPDLGQCCGGSVRLEFSRAAPPSPQSQPLWIWGAGHVGRATAQVIAPMDVAAITLVDTTVQRMPDALPTGVTPLVAADMLRVVTHAPQDADHLVMTYAHDLDLALCDALLRHGFANAGLIGSATKWARFQKRLHALGHASAEISRIACPIGDPSLGKHPQAIAIGVASAFLRGRTARQDS